MASGKWQVAPPHQLSLSRVETNLNLRHKRCLCRHRHRHLKQAAAKLRAAAAASVPSVSDGHRCPRSFVARCSCSLLCPPPKSNYNACSCCRFMFLLFCSCRCCCCCCCHNCCSWPSETSLGKVKVFPLNRAFFMQNLRFSHHAGNRVNAAYCRMRPAESGKLK